MLDLAHLLHLLSFTLGAVALVLVYVIGKQAGRRVVWSYLVMLFCINLVSAGHAFESFIKIKHSLAVSSVGLEAQLDALAIVLSALRIVIAHQFLRFAWRLTRHAWKPALDYVFPGLLLANGLLQLLAVNAAGPLAGSYLDASVTACRALLFLALMAGSYRLYAFAHQARAQPVAGRVRVLAGFWFVYALLILANRVAGEAHLVSLDAQLLGFGASTLVLNALHVFFSKRFLAGFRHSDRQADYPGWEHRLAEFGITRREQDILRLVCQGKTNKEIAAALFITPNTVRDHASNIFRKTNTANRTQLAALFRSAGS